MDSHLGMLLVIVVITADSRCDIERDRPYILPDVFHHSALIALLPGVGSSDILPTSQAEECSVTPVGGTSTCPYVRHSP